MCVLDFEATCWNESDKPNNTLKSNTKEYKYIQT